MVPETLVFMPNGDVTLTLIRHVLKEEDTPSKNPEVVPENGEKKPLDEDAEIDAALGVEPETPAEAEDSFLFYAPDPPGFENGPLYPPPPRAGRGSDASSRRDRSKSPPASFWASLKRQAAKVMEPVEDELTVTPKPAKKPERIVLSSHEVHCIVSSRHMILASQFFEAILSGNSNEANTLRAKGHVSIALSADLDTMIILLNIIHGASRKVPRQVNLESLSQLAILVSNLGMLETVQFFSDTWIDGLQREGLPKSYNEDVLSLLHVFWVFDRAAEFKNMARLAQRECDETLAEDLGNVPIPHNIIDAIKRDREFAIETALTVIHALITRYMDGQTICEYALDDELRYACDAMVLGSLMKSSRKIGIWPIPEAPFSGRKFKDLARAIRSIRILDVCTKSRRSTRPSSNCHGLEDSIEASMKSIEAGLEGLELSDYARKSEDYHSGFQLFLPMPSKEEIIEPAKEDPKNDSQMYMKNEVVDEPKEEVKISQREYIEPVENSRISTRSNSMEAVEAAQKEVKESTRHQSKEFKFQQGNTQVSSKAIVQEAEVPVQEGVKVEPRHSSRDFQREEARYPPKANGTEVAEPVKEERKVDASNGLHKESRNATSHVTKQLYQPPKEEVKPVPTEEVKVLGDRKLNRTTSFPKSPRDEVKSPVKELQAAPRVASIDEIEKITRPQKEEVKLFTVEPREIVKEVPAPTDEEDLLAPAQNFKMRKSKKKFSSRF